MYERATTLRGRNARASRAEVAAARCRLPAGRAAASLRMPAGIVWSIERVERGETPMARSIASRAAVSGPMWRDWNDPWVSDVMWSKSLAESGLLSVQCRDVLCRGSRRTQLAVRVARGSSAELPTFTTIIQVPCGSVLTGSGLSVSAVFTSTTSPLTRRSTARTRP